jgi:phage tail-like protein
LASLANINKVLETIFGPLDPAAEFRFYLEVDGLVEGAFAECSGMKAEREILTVKEGGVNHYAHKLPGRTTYGDITLRKGIMFAIELWDWFEEGIKDGDVDHRDMTIIHYSSYFNIPARWYHVKKAYPVSWEAASLRTDSSQLAMESVTLTFQTLEVEDWGLLDLAAKLAF